MEPEELEELERELRALLASVGLAWVIAQHDEGWSEPVRDESAERFYQRAPGPRERMLALLEGARIALTVPPALAARGSRALLANTEANRVVLVSQVPRSAADDRHELDVSELLEPPAAALAALGRLREHLEASAE